MKYPNVTIINGEMPMEGDRGGDFQERSIVDVGLAADWITFRWTVNKDATIGLIIIQNFLRILLQEEFNVGHQLAVDLRIISCKHQLGLWFSQ